MRARFRTRGEPAKTKEQNVSGLLPRCCALRLALSLSSAAFAEPARIIILRHAEKAPYDDLPANDWDAPEPRHLDRGCKK